MRRIITIALLVFITTSIVGALPIGIGGYYLYGIPIDQLKYTERTTSTVNEAWDMTDGYAMKHGPVNFGFAFFYDLPQINPVLFEVGFEYHDGYENDACTLNYRINGGNLVTLPVSADLFKLRLMMITAGIRYDITQFPPFFETYVCAGYLLSINKLTHQLGRRTDWYHTGNAHGAYGGGGLNIYPWGYGPGPTLAFAIPFRFHYLFDADYELYDPNGNQPTPETLRIKHPYILTIGFGLELFLN